MTNKIWFSSNIAGKCLLRRLKNPIKSLSIVYMTVTAKNILHTSLIVSIIQSFLYDTYSNFKTQINGIYNANI